MSYQAELQASQRITRKQSLEARNSLHKVPILSLR